MLFVEKKTKKAKDEDKGKKSDNEEDKHKQNSTVSHLQLTNTSPFGSNILVEAYSCKGKESELYLETFFNLEKMNKKIDKAFTKRPTKERLVKEKNII